LDFVVIAGLRTLSSGVVIQNPTLIYVVVIVATGVKKADCNTFLGKLLSARLIHPNPRCSTINAKFTNFARGEQRP
jgi:hypothetical protein